MVLRFTNEQLYVSEEGVWQEILKSCLERYAPSPGPSRKGRGVSASDIHIVSEKA